MNKCIYILFFILTSNRLFSQNAEPLVFERAFSGDTTFTDPYIPSRFRMYTMGKIKIESGKIMSCDIEELHNAFPFPQVFPKGDFPVQLAIAIDIENLTAYSRILFSTQPVKTWKYISSPGVKENPVTDTGYNRCIYKEGIGVAVFIDSVANKALNQKPHSIWGDLFINKIKKPGSPGAIYNFDNHSVAAFSGNLYVCFGMYIGYDKNGKICRLLANLGRIALPGYR